LCLLIAGVATLMQQAEQALAHRAWLESVVLSILIGAGARALWTPSTRWRAGIRFSAKTILEVAVVLLGASLNGEVLMSIGPPLLLGIVAVVIVSILCGYGLGRGMGLPRRTAVLVACGNSICGNSAIAAIAPIIGADGCEVAVTIAFTAVMGVLAVLFLPLLGQMLHMDALQYGALAGLTVYAVPQVLAATAPVGGAAVQIGTVIKLCRVMMLGPVTVGLSMVAGHLRDPSETGPIRAPKLTQLAPWFIIGFAALALLRAAGGIPVPMISPIATIAGILTVVSMAALGLETDLRAVLRAGRRVAFAAVASLLLLGAISLGLIWSLHSPV
jgi:uncharacterized integral membrane protein (TIGR00698 family)